MNRLINATLGLNMGEVSSQIGAEDTRPAEGQSFDERDGVPPGAAP